MPGRALFVVEDHHGLDALRRSMDDARTRGESAAVLTGDALLAMRLRKDGLDVRLTIDRLSPEIVAERDRLALDAVSQAFGDSRNVLQASGQPLRACLEYTLIPAFVRAVRHVTAVDDELRCWPCDRVVLVSGGGLVEAARLVAKQRRLATQSVDDDLWQRTVQGVSRLREGRATRWVNTNFRALFLEPGFILSLFLKGFWQRLMSGTPSPQPRRTLIVAGDRFTADVVERLRGHHTPLVLAGATEPGRALFERAAGLRPLEAFTELVDPLRAIEALFDAISDAIALARNEAHRSRFVVADVSYWPLVKWTVCLHLVSWMPLLRHLRLLTRRAVRQSDAAELLVSNDVTAYNRVLIDTARELGVPSVGIQHGMTAEPNGHSTVRVDTLAAWGTATESWYRALRPQNARFLVTGNPRFDTLASRPPKPGNAERDQPFTVLICTGFVSEFSVCASAYENLAMIDAVMAWATTRPQVRVIHKMHPGEEREYYEAARRALGWDPVTLTLIADPILHDLIGRSDVLVAGYSTTALESLVLGTPAIVFDALVQRRLQPLDRLPGVSIASSIDELNAQLDLHLAGPPPDPRILRASIELRAYVSDLDGNATERVAALVDTNDRADSSARSNT